jgi:hypothetical protein
MFRVGVASLVFVASFHPPVQSKWFHKTEPAVHYRTAELTRLPSPLDRHEKLTARSSETTPRQARP